MIETTFKDDCLKHGYKEVKFGMPSSIKINAPKLGGLIGPVVAIHGLDEFHFFIIQLKVENLEILFKSLNF